jgi:hypothetical protein
MSSIINADTSGGLKLESDVSGQLEIQTAAATKVTVTSAGNVGIGTSTPAQKFVVSDGGVNFATSVSGSVQNIGTFTDNTLAVIANSVEQMRVTSAGLLSFNSGYGSVAPAYGCRAWVNFNGTGTIAIVNSHNVSSLTDVGTGKYIVNLSNNLTGNDTGAASCNAMDGTDNGNGRLAVAGLRNSAGISITIGEGGADPDFTDYTDHSPIHMILFGD